MVRDLLGIGVGRGLATERVRIEGDDEPLRIAPARVSSSRTPLDDVAARTGFQTQQHFTEVFHRYTGMTSRAFRLSARCELLASGRRTSGLQNPDKSSQE